MFYILVLLAKNFMKIIKFSRSGTFCVFELRKKVHLPFSIAKITNLSQKKQREKRVVYNPNTCFLIEINIILNISLFIKMLLNN